MEREFGDYATHSNPANLVREIREKASAAVGHPVRVRAVELAEKVGEVGKVGIDRDFKVYSPI